MPDTYVMNGEGGETFLRLLAEAEMRDQLAPSPPPWTGSLGAGRVKVTLVGQALTAVRALDTDTVENILADFDLAVSVRRLHDKAGQGPAGTGLPGVRPGTMRTAAAARLAARIQLGRSGPPGPAGASAGRRGAPDHPDRRTPRTRRRPITNRVRVRPTGSSRSG